MSAEASAIQPLFDAIHEACSANVWSRGVELVRAEAVSGEASSAMEITLRVSTRGGLVSPLVTFYPADADWECSCKGEEDPCEHVAAAAIALRQARKQGLALPAPQQAPGRIRYRLREEQGQLCLEREIAGPDGSVVLASMLDAVASGRVAGPRFVATPRDIAVERALGSRRRGAIPRETMRALFEGLAGSSEVDLDGVPVQVSAEPVLPNARVVDAPGGVRLYVEQDPSITRVFRNGAVLCADVLRRVAESRLSGRELEELPRGRFYAADQLAELVTEVLPSLQARIPVEIRSRQLPRITESEPPRILLEVERRGDKLSILPTLVYGTPPCARIDAGRLVHLQGPIPVRDEAAERARLRHLRSELGLQPGHRIELEGEAAIDFAAQLAHWRGELRGDAHRAFHRLPELVPRVSIEDGERFALDFELSQGDAAANSPRPAAAAIRRAATADVLRCWREGASLVPIMGGGFAPLPADWLARYGDRVADLLAARDASGRVPTCALPDLGRLCDDLDQPPPARLEGLRPLLASGGVLPVAPLPADLQVELRDYQRRGVDWLCFLAGAGLGALLADDMGLGKTVQTLCALRGRCLVVAPTSLLHNWADEMRRFRPGLRFSLYHGPNRQLDAQADVTLTSYAILRLDSDRLARENWDCVVLDEAQNIKNPDSQVARAAYGLQAKARIALTGTPVENRLAELWSQFHFLNRGLLGGRADFEERIERPIADGDTLAAERLRERIRPFLLRRLKRDVAPELPPRSEVVLHCELSSEERVVYDAVRAASVDPVVKQLQAGGNVMAALEALLRLRQAACHPGLVPGQEASNSSKVSLLVERLEQAVADGHKALVFSQWTALLDRVEPPLRAAGIDFVRLDGSTRDRAAVVAAFQERDEVPVMLVSLRAGGTGLNLTAADHIFLLDPWWNPAVEDQAADRAHRIGQSRPVVVHRIVAQNTVEERILELHARKRALSELALGGELRAEGLSRDDLLALLAE